MVHTQSTCCSARRKFRSLASFRQAPTCHLGLVAMRSSEHSCRSNTGRWAPPRGGEQDWQCRGNLLTLCCNRDMQHCNCCSSDVWPTFYLHCVCWCYRGNCVVIWFSDTGLEKKESFKHGNSLTFMHRPWELYLSPSGSLCQIWRTWRCRIHKRGTYGQHFCLDSTESLFSLFWNLT